MDTPSTCAREYSVATDGCDFPFSSWDTNDARHAELPGQLAQR